MRRKGSLTGEEKIGTLVGLKSEFSEEERKLRPGEGRSHIRFLRAQLYPILVVGGNIKN